MEGVLKEVLQGSHEKSILAVLLHFKNIVAFNTDEKNLSFMMKRMLNMMIKEYKFTDKD
jgi:hypothetical protein